MEREGAVHPAEESGSGPEEASFAPEEASFARRRAKGDSPEHPRRAEGGGPEQADDRRGQPHELGQRLVALTGVRLLIATALLCATIWLTHGPSPVSFGRPMEWLLYAIVATIYGVSLVAMLSLRRGRSYRAFALGLAGDVLSSTGLVYLTGAAESIFTVLYPLSIVNGAIGGGRRGAWTAAAWSTVAFLGLAVCTEVRWIPLPVLLEREPLPLSRLAINLGANVGAMFLTAQLAAQLAHALVGAHRRLEKAETELSVLSALHAEIVRSIPTGILAVDEESRVTFLNPAAEEICELGSEALRGRPLADHLPDFARVVEEARAQSGRGETTLSRKDGGHRIVGYSVAPLLGTELGERTGSVLVFQDLTELRRMEQQVRRADRLAALGEIAAGLAHEMRNPLASMSGSIGLLTAGAGLPEKDRRLLKIVQREAERLELLLRDFLSYARPTEPRLRPLSLRELVEEVTTLLRPTLPPRGIALEVELGADARVRADGGQLKQVLWNLLANAVDATPEGGRVRVALSRNGSEAVVAIADTGAGISSEDLPRIFTPFFTTKERGTGLGLAIVHRIVEAHGGTIQVQSAPGEGSTFMLAMPLAD
jgi:two-component system sensor histidine kinase PilS (NtrC family)